MDTRKCETKTLIAEYHNLSKLKDCRFSENAYKLKDGSKIIQYDGNGLSIYGTCIAFGRHIGRKGIYSISDKEYEIWKIIRRENKSDYFVDWEEDCNNQVKETEQEQYNSSIEMHICY